MTIEGIALEHSNALPKRGINASTKPCPCHAVLHSFLSDVRKKDAFNTTAHSNSLIALLKGVK